MAPGEWASYAASLRPPIWPKPPVMVSAGALDVALHLFPNLIEPLGAEEIEIADRARLRHRRHDAPELEVLAYTALRRVVVGVEFVALRCAAGGDDLRPAMIDAIDRG